MQSGLDFDLYFSRGLFGRTRIDSVPLRRRGDIVAEVDWQSNHGRSHGIVGGSDVAIKQPQLQTALLRLRLRLRLRRKGGREREFVNLEGEAFIPNGIQRFPLNGGLTNYSHSHSGAPSCSPRIANFDVGIGRSTFSK